MNKSSKEVKKEDVKTTGQVIIRREVIVENDNDSIKNQTKSNREGIGFTQNRKKDYNIVYRERPSKPMTVSELFGIKPKKQEKEVPVKKVEEKKETVKKENEEIVVTTTESKKEVKVEKIENSSPVRTTNSLNTKTFNKTNKFNKDGKDNRNTDFRGNRESNQGGFKKNNQQSSNKNFNNNKEFNRRPLGRNNDKDLDLSQEFVEKEQRDYSSKFIDKQKANRNFEDKKKATRSRKFSDEENFNGDKLRDLKQIDKLSNMFENQDGGMLDYYDLTTERGKKNKRKGVKKENRNKQKIFELKEITIPSLISVKDLATELKKTSAEVLKKLIELGIMANLNQDLDFDTAYLVADSFGVNTFS